MKDGKRFDELVFVGVKWEETKDTTGLVDHGTGIYTLQKGKWMLVVYAKYSYWAIRKVAG